MTSEHFHRGAKKNSFAVTVRLIHSVRCLISYRRFVKLVAAISHNPEWSLPIYLNVLCKTVLH